MSLPREITQMRLLAIALCLLAFSVYITFAPVPVYAASCNCSEGNGTCNGRAECVCMFANGVCTNCQWVQGSANCEVPPEN